MTSIEARSGTDNPGNGSGIRAEVRARRRVKLESAVLLLGILLVLLVVAMTMGGAPPG
ncbi:MAG: hypothetical protein ACHQ01_10010 [Candidatus Limnocylindrales bacterium]